MMAANSDVCASLIRHRSLLLRELCDTNILSVLVHNDILSVDDKDYISNVTDSEKKCEFFIEIIARHSSLNLSDFCSVMEKECPVLTSEIIKDHQNKIWNGFTYNDNTKDNMVMDCNINRESPRSRRSSSRCSCDTPLSPTPAPLNNTVEMYVEPVVEETAEGGGGWETHRVRLRRVPGYGFGIAVSGGRDNPHFASGDPAIAVSDVLRAGPAEDKLQVNDRIVSANGVPLENVEYARAVQVLRDSGGAVSLVVRRRAPAAPALSAPRQTLKFSLSKAGKKEDFGVVLGCRLFIKELTPKARDQLNAAGQVLCEGDVITRINNTNCADAMSLKEAKKIIDSCKERLNLVVTRELVREATVPTVNNVNQGQNLYHNSFNSMGSEGLTPAYSGQNLYVAAPSRSTLLGDEPRLAGSVGGGGPGPGRRAPLSMGEVSQLDPQGLVGHPPRPPPPRQEDYYSSRKQLYEEDLANQRSKPVGSLEARLISFQKEGSVGLRLAGGNRAGVFVSAVQPGSPAALQGLAQADKILKVNDMEMKGVTREEAVLFLLSLQERIDLIVQHSPDEYNAVTSGQMVGDSFHIKCHFHYTDPIDGEMSFRCGDVFHVVDTLHNGTVGAWQVYRIGRSNQEVQKGIIPNKARAEELATAQFNATKKEMVSGTDSRTNFFRRRRSTHRRSKSLGKDHWDDVVFSDSISKFPAYERVVLKHPGFVRPVILFGAISDLAREKLLRDYPDKFSAPQMDNSNDEGGPKCTSGIIRLSGIRSVMDRGRHALLDITPNAVDRLNYAQFYPLVIFLKPDSKHTIKQLRQGLPKSAHKSSKKLLEQCQQLERTWGHVFTHTVTLNDTSGTSWYPKLTDLLHRSQQQQLWVSETKRSEPLSDDFLFPMSASTENRLSYASSPESDLDVSPPPHSPRLVKSSSDPSVATTQDNLDRDDEINNINTINNLSMMNDAVPPPYTSGYSDSKYGFSVTNGAPNNMGGGNPNQHNTQGPCLDVHGNAQYPRSPMAHSPPQSPLYGTVPELPPRMDRTPGAPGSGTPGSGAPSSGTPHKPAGGVLLPGPPPGSAGRSTLRHNPSTTRPSAQERLFGPPKEGVGGPGIEEGAYSERPTSIAGAPGSLDRHRHLNNTNSYDSMSSSYSYTNPAGPPSGPAPNPSGPLSPLPPAPSLLAISTNRLGPNAPDDLKVAPGKFDHTANPGPNTNSISPLRNSVHEHSSTNASLEYRTSDATAAYRDVYRAHRTPLPPANGAGAPRGTNPIQPNTDYSKYSSRADYVTSASNGGRPLSGSGAPGGGGGAPAYKPVPPPKPKHYRPPGNEERHHAKSYSMGNGNMDMLNGSSHQGVPNRNSGPTNGYGGGAGVYGGGGGGGISHTHSHSHPAPAPAQYQQPPIYSHHGVYGGAPPQSPPYNGPPQHHRPGPGPGAGAMNLPPNPHLIDLAGSREQRGSAFELYRKPQHMHSMSGNEDIGLMNANAENEANFTPKTKKKLSKKPSFIKNAVLDLFRSKANKSTNKVSRQQSLCENDLQHGGHRAPLRREKSDLSGMTNHIRNAQMRNQALNRSNSTCDKQPALKPILKRQSSFSDGRSGVTCTVRDYDATPIIKNLRRQSSMCDMETEPKVKTTLRRQNSLIDYGRRDISGLNGNFNMITQIDPIYQRQFEIKHEPFHPTQPLPPEPTYQRKEEVIYDPIPKPKRTFASTSFNQSTENPYSTQSDMSDMSMESSYVSQQQPFERKMTESPYSTRSECLQKNAYSLKTDPNYELKNEDRESLYATREQIQKQRKFHESPYSTKEEMLRQRFSESPYGTRESPYGTRESPYGTRESPYGTRESPYGTRESPYGTRENSYGTKGNLYGTRESPYGTRDNPSESPYTTKEALKKSMDMSRSTYTEGLYASKQEILRQNMPIMSTYPGRVSPVNKCISEPPYASKSEMLARSPESPYATRQEVRSCSESPYATRQEIINEKAGTSEKIYVSKQEILTMKAANKESPYATRAQMEDKFEIIRQRNQAKKEMIYQSRKDVAETRVREPIYVSKRELKDTVIYESHQEVKEHVQNNLENRDSPYELGDANHLVRRDPVYQTKAETLGLVGCAPFKEIDFASLRLTESQTDSEKQSKLKLERSVLRGEPVYQPRLHGKASHISNALKITGSPVPYESTTSMETQYISECSSINFDGKPHSTPYASQDLPENAQDRLPTFKSNRSVSFNDKILEKSPDTTVNSGDNTMNGNETTVINNETTVIENNKTSNIIDTENGNDTSKPVEPEAPNTTWGIFDSEGGLLEDRQWGVSLIIPPKAIAPGIKQKIYFTVSDPRHSTRVGGPPIDMDNGEAMLSPLVMCGPQGLVFLRPVTLRLPHCANAVPSLGLTIKATDTEAHLSTDWDNIHLPATTTLNTVAVKVDHF